MPSLAQLVPFGLPHLYGMTTTAAADGLPRSLPEEAIRYIPEQANEVARRVSSQESPVSDDRRSLQKETPTADTTPTPH